MASTASLPAYMLSGVPVHQPPHLEGDASLATEILPGPPSLVSMQQSLLKRDPRKPSTTFSYLPPSDPGSTYSGIMHGTLIGHEHDTSRLKRSKAAIGRAQRASARNQNGATSTNDLPAENETVSTSNPYPTSVDLESYTMVVDDEPSMSCSFHNPQEGASTGVSGRPRRRDKGKGKEAEPTTIRVKEEPKQISLLTPDPPPTNLLNNDDHCSSCRSHGALVYCDGCPRAFHLWCLDPPMESVDEGDSRWFCPACTIRKHPPRKPPPSLLSPLIHQVETTIPTEFQLPEDVRTFFKDVAAGPKGTYVDSSESKPPRLNRHGQQEDRDSYRLKDRNGAPVLCFRCGTSALPLGLAAAAPATKRARRSSTIAKASINTAWKSIVTCDYCNLHWHLDCLDPPLQTLPPITKKWMCPNHAEQILPSKRRIPKQYVPPIEITKPRQFNNGNIELIHPETTRPSQIAPKVTVDEVLINGRRYRVPERIIVLDFWNKLNKSEHPIEKDPHLVSGMSSPLTSLSSLDDPDERTLPELSTSRHDVEELQVAQLLYSLHVSRTGATTYLSIPPIVNGIHKSIAETAVQTDPEYPIISKARVVKLPKAVNTPKLRTAPKMPSANGSTRTPKLQNKAAAIPSDAVPSTAKRKKLVQPTQTEPSTRELRSRSKNNIDSSLTSISSRSSMKRADDSGRDSLLFEVPSAPALSGKSQLFHVKVKVEETETNVFGNNSTLVAGPSSHTPAKPRYRVIGRARETPPAGRRAARKDAVVSKPEIKEKRGRKRKERDDDLPATDGRGLAETVERVDPEKKDKRPRAGKKAVRTPSRPGPISPLTHTVPIGTAPNLAPTTPSLKIRLPRLNNATASVMPNTSSDTPTRL